MITKILKTKINSEHIIIDIEIGNDLSPDWDYKKADIVTLGILNGNKITIIQREKTDNLEEFKIVMTDILKNINEFYAFNFKFEIGALSGFLGEEYNAKEIKPFSGKGWSKDKFFDTLLKIVKIENETNNSFADGSLVQKKYDEEKYEEIIGHNTNCLIKEAYINKYCKEILKEYEGKINSDGWIQEDNKNTSYKDNWKKEPATERQLNYLIRLGCKEKPKNKLEASNLIDRFTKGGGEPGKNDTK